MKTTLAEHIDYYLNESGLMVLTEQYLLERGYCCGSGCKHCPYQTSQKQSAQEEDTQFYDQETRSI